MAPSSIARCVIRLMAITGVGFAFISSAAAAELPEYRVAVVVSEDVVVYLGPNARGQVAGEGFSRSFLFSDNAVVDLSALLGNFNATPGAMSDAGHIVGSVEGRAWLYFNGAVSLLEIPDLDIENLATRAVAVNSSGQIVVHALAPPYLEARSLLYAKGVYTDIGSLGGSNTMAVAMNEEGQVAGTGTASDGSEHAFLYSSGTMIDLGRGSVIALNDAGMVAGIAESGRAFRYADGSVADLGTLGGDTSQTRGLNDVGQVVGGAQVATGTFHAFVSDGTAMRDLGTFGGQHSFANAINNDGSIVGQALYANGQPSGFVFSNGELRDLNNLIVLDRNDRIVDGIGINDRGQILVARRAAPEENSLALLTPIRILLDDLIRSSNRVGPDRKLPKQVALAAAYYEADDLVATCSQLANFRMQVRKLPVKKTPQAVKDSLTTQAEVIMGAVGCP